MTEEEKKILSLFRPLTGAGGFFIRQSDATNPIVEVHDGPCGLRDFKSPSKQDETIATCFPSPSALAAAFDPDLAYKTGSLLAKECAFHQVDVILGPGANIKRSALCGRNFEYFSEDPCLSGLMAAAWIRGVEENGVGTALKHFALNNQEYRRLTISSEVAERPLHEIYLRSFEYALKNSSPWCVMTSYNLVNGTHVGEDPDLLRSVLRQEFQYQGLLISDWGAVFDKAASITAGLDVEMPEMPYEDNYLLSLVQEKKVAVNDLVERNKELANAENLIRERRQLARDRVDYPSQHQAEVALADATVILAKNERGFLPLDPSKKVTVIGYLANHPHFNGGGSAHVCGFMVPTFSEALENHHLPYELIEGYRPGECTLSPEEMQCLKDSGVLLLFLGQYQEEGGRPCEDREGVDRTSIDLPSEQRALLASLAPFSSKLVILVESGSVVDLYSAVSSARSLLVSYPSGEGENEAIVDNLYGFHNPCGHFPETWIHRLNANPLYRDYDRSPFRAFYDEDIFVGYRFYDKIDNRGVLFPFGFGLSYSTFSFSSIKIDFCDEQQHHVNVSCSVKNTSPRDGKVSVQVYVRKVDSSYYREKKSLKAFQSIFLHAGETQRVAFSLDQVAFDVFNVERHRFEVERGEYEIQVGDSSAHLPLKTTIFLEGDVFKSWKKPQPLPRLSVFREQKVTFDWPACYVTHDPFFRKRYEARFLDAPDYCYGGDSGPLYRLQPGGFRVSRQEMEAFVGYLNHRSLPPAIYRNFYLLNATTSMAEAFHLLDLGFNIGIRTADLDQVKKLLERNANRSLVEIIGGANAAFWQGVKGLLLSFDISKVLLVSSFARLPLLFPAKDYLTGLFVNKKQTLKKMKKYRFVFVANAEILGDEDVKAYFADGGIVEGRLEKNAARHRVFERATFFLASDLRDC